ncbi:MAG: hypothetical protein H6P98_965 [Candidatus Aminicenantes bacterium]|nr:hypothetical protein [Candidatus Aminicenantes bacterium]
MTRLPGMIRVKQVFDGTAVEDVAAEISSQIAKVRALHKTKKGQVVAVACGSRGIADYPSIVGATVRALRQKGLRPFLVPAMGSHGAATAAGQKKVLERMGLAERTLGVPVLSSLKTVKIGETEDRIPVYVDALALRADCIVPVNRIKSHTDFTGEIESGLMKLMAIGLGKKRGASVYHRAMFELGYSRVITSVARKVLESGKVLFGVAIVENGYGRTAKLRALEAEDIEAEEKTLLKEAKGMAPRLPFDDVDLLIVDEIGKEISGTGMDTKVVGRILLPLLSREPASPRVRRIVACDLTDHTAGNSLGIGLADYVTQRLRDKIDFRATNLNALAGGCPEQARIPLALGNDRQAIEAAARSIGNIPPDKLKIVRIKNTMRLADVFVSEAYRGMLRRRKDLQVVAEEGPLRFDPEGNLRPFSKESELDGYHDK